MFSMPGSQELILILIIVLLVFGGKKIPEMMAGIGKGVRSFKKGLNNPDEEEIADLEDKAQRLEKAKKAIEDNKKIIEELGGPKSAAATKEEKSA
jgi:sec-independent protein translocase protein TatA